MNLLIDTHLLLWAAFDEARIGGRGRALMLDPANRLYFSVASLWEVAIKRGLNRPDFTVDPGPLRAGLLASGYEELVVEGRHVLGLTTLSAHHADPFDRLLVVQAAAEGMRLLTADRRLADYGDTVLAV